MSEVAGVPLWDSTSASSSGSKRLEVKLESLSLYHFNQVFCLSLQCAVTVFEEDKEKSFFSYFSDFCFNDLNSSCEDSALPLLNSTT